MEKYPHPDEWEKVFPEIAEPLRDLEKAVHSSIERQDTSLKSLHEHVAAMQRSVDASRG